MDIVISIVLVVGVLAGVLAGLFLLFTGGRKKNKMLSIAGGIIAVVFLSIFMIRSMGCSSGDTGAEKVERFEQAAGQYIGTQLKGKKVLVILGENLPEGDKKVQDVMYEAFKQTYAAQPVEHRITRLNTYGLTPDEAVSAFNSHFEALDKAFADADANACEVIVQFIPLAVPNAERGWVYDQTFPEKAKILLMPNAIRLDAIHARKIAQNFFEQGLLYGIVAEKKGFNYKEEVPEDAGAAFNKRYVLITPENKDRSSEYLDYSTEEE